MAYITYDIWGRPLWNGRGSEEIIGTLKQPCEVAIGRSPSWPEWFWRGVWREGVREGTWSGYPAEGYPQSPKRYELDFKNGVVDSVYVRVFDEQGRHCAGYRYQSEPSVALFSASDDCRTFFERELEAVQRFLAACRADADIVPAMEAVQRSPYRLPPTQLMERLCWILGCTSSEAFHWVAEAQRRVRNG